MLARMADPEWLRRVSPLRRAAFAGFREASRALHLLAFGFQRVAAGTLKDAELRAASRHEWSDYNTSAAAVDAGLRGWERRWYGDRILPGERVVVVGCGAGRELIPLAARGLDVTGLDPVPALIAKAREHLARHELRATLIAAAVEDWEIRDTFDVFVFSDRCYGCIRPAAARVRALSAAARHLTASGRILVSITPPVSVNGWGTVVLRLGNRLGRTDWRAEPGDVFGLASPPDDGLDYHHAFAPGEIEREATAAGLAIVACEDAENVRVFELRAAGGG